MNAIQPIPRMIHQTWKTDVLPPALEVLRQSWLTRHPAWQHVLWTDADLRAFLLRHYPWFIPTYDGYDEPIKRVDACRYFILHHFGGVYIDLDFECLRPIDDLLRDETLLFGLEPAAHAAEPGVRSRGLSQILCNAFMASAAGDPFWEYLFPFLMEARAASSVLDATGPFLLTRAYQRYPERERVAIVPAALLYPLNRDESWDDALSPEQLRARAGPEAYAIHYWHGVWRREAVIRAARARLHDLRARPGKNAAP